MSFSVMLVVVDPTVEKSRKDMPWSAVAAAAAAVMMTVGKASIMTVGESMNDDRGENDRRLPVGKR